MTNPDPHQESSDSSSEPANSAVLDFAGIHRIIRGYISKIDTALKNPHNCSDAGQDCPFAVTTKTEDELMQHVAAHASVAHPDMELTSETIAQVKGLIRTV